jgi:alpha-1,6-mannosyltransferase
VTIHFTTYPVQTGASLFTFTHSDPSAISPAIPRPHSPAWIYDKAEDPSLSTPGGAAEAGVEWDVLVTEDWKAWEGKGFKLASTIRGQQGVERGGQFGIRVKWGEKIGILTRDA